MWGMKMYGKMGVVSDQKERKNYSANGEGFGLFAHLSS